MRVPIPVALAAIALGLAATAVVLTQPPAADKGPFRLGTP